MEWYNEPPNGRPRTAGSRSNRPAKRLLAQDPRRRIPRQRPFLLRIGHGDFEAEVTIQGEYAVLYDQAGLMVRENESTGLKCGIELLNGVQQASVVVTRDFSDWSVIPLDPPPATIRFLIRRHGGTVEVSYALPGGEFHLQRQATLSATATLQVGIMCCAPTGGGFTARFEGLRIAPVR
jgi:regulation of enolase protein 1 (concanavalin A-like superfamily)